MKKHLLILLATCFCFTFNVSRTFGDKVFELDCNSSGCRDKVTNTYVSAAVASTRNRINASGLLESVAVDTVRTEYDSTLNKWWMKSEGMAVNLCTYSDDFTQASWVKTDMSAAKDQTGPDGVTNSASLISATDANATILLTTSSPNGAHTASFWLKRVTGTGTVSITVDNGANWTAKTITSSWVRYSDTQTTTNPVIGIKIDTNGDEVAVAKAQVETGSFYTSEITTSGTIGVRASEEGAVDTTTLATGTFTAASGALLSAEATNSFIYMASMNLAAYVNAAGDRYRIVVADDDDGYLTGYIYAADTGIAYGSNANTNSCANSGVTPYDTFDGASATGFHAVTDGSDVATGGTDDEVVQTEGQLWYVSFDATLTGGEAPIGGFRADVDSAVDFGQKTAAAGANTVYSNVTANDTRVYGFANTAAAAEYTIANLAVKKVTNVAATGVRIVTAKDGAVEGWTETAGGDGFDWNLATYTVTISFVETNGYYVANASLAWPTNWATGMDPAGSMTVNWYPLTAQSTYTGSQDYGLISLSNTALSLLYLDDTNKRLSSNDSTNETIHDTDWTSAGKIKVANTWDAVTTDSDIYQAGVDKDGTFDTAWATGTNLVFFFDNNMPNQITGLRFFDETITGADISNEYIKIPKYYPPIDIFNGELQIEMKNVYYLFVNF